MSTLGETMNEIFNTNDILPEEGKFVLGYVNYDNWVIDSDKSGKVYWRVVYLVKGISIEERETLHDQDPRKRIHRFGDVFGNNLVTYSWGTFGPSNFYGQDITRWCHLPDVPKI